MRRPALMLLGFSLLMGLETAYFARRCVAGLLRLGGQSAFFINDQAASLRRYERALAWGGSPDRIEADIVDLLLFSVDQVETGLKVTPVLPPREALRIAHELIARRLRAAPYRAAYWGLASDIYLYEARQRRRAVPLDLSTLPEDPLDLLLPEDWLALSALVAATRLEPTNYRYHDLLVGALLSARSPRAAAPHCRRAVAAFPDLDAHAYLLDPELAPELLDAAIHGFEDALSAGSMIPREAIERNAGRLLGLHARDREAVAHLERAVAAAPGDYDAWMDLAMSTYRLKEHEKAIVDLEAASRLSPEDPHPYYYKGLCLLSLGRREEAISELRKARELGAGEIRFFHRLAEALEEAGRVKEAERQLVAAANLHPGDAEAWGALLTFYLRQRDATAAAEVCARWRSTPRTAAAVLERCAGLGGGPP